MGSPATGADDNGSAVDDLAADLADWRARILGGMFGIIHDRDSLPHSPADAELQTIMNRQ